MLRKILPLTLLSATLAFADHDDFTDDFDETEWQPTPPPLTEATPDYDVEQAPAAPPSQRQFEQQLYGYGDWYDEPGLGRVWRPSVEVVGSDFVPYSTGGNWVSTRVGWQFVTRYPFGTAPFHYGRWHRSPRYGWVWWPSYVWGPSWVDWRCRRGGEVAWMPMAPPGITVRFGPSMPYWSFSSVRRHMWEPPTFRPRWGHAWGGPRYYHAAQPLPPSPGYRNVPFPPRVASPVMPFRPPVPAPAPPMRPPMPGPSWDNRHGVSPAPGFNNGPRMGPPPGVPFQQTNQRPPPPPGNGFGRGNGNGHENGNGNGHGNGHGHGHGEGGRHRR